MLQISILAMPPYQGQCETNPKVLFKESTHVLGGSFNEIFRMFNPENWGRLPVSIHISLFFLMVSPLTDVGVRYPKKGGPNFQNQETLSPKNRLLESQKRVTTYFFPVLVFKGLPV